MSYSKEGHSLTNLENNVRLWHSANCQIRLKLITRNFQVEYESLRPKSIRFRGFLLPIRLPLYSHSQMNFALISKNLKGYIAYFIEGTSY